MNTLARLSGLVTVVTLFHSCGGSTVGGSVDMGSELPDQRTGPGDFSVAFDLLTPIDLGPASDDSVLQRNHHLNRDGQYLQPLLTKAAATTLQRDRAFQPTVIGNVYAQPLYVADGPGGAGVFYVVTESNNVHAIDEMTGAAVWMKNLGTPASATGAGCGNVSPIGITGTPYIDHGSRTLFIAAAAGNAQAILRYEVHALSLDNGAERANFPVTIATTFESATFSAPVQIERGALIALGSTIYIPYGGHYGDCGNYRGWVVGVPFSGGAVSGSWSTGARGGGVWAPGGIASDGTSLFVATGNSFNVNVWSGGEAIIRLSPGPLFSGQAADYFTPSNWKALDNADVDVGGSEPLLVDLPGATPATLAVALGKNGVAYLLNRNNLGGPGNGNGTTGEGLYSAKVASGEIINAPASYTTNLGTYVVFHIHSGDQGMGCPNGQSGDLVSLRLTAGAAPRFTVAWCANNQGEGSPIATTTDGRNEAIVWTAGAEGSRRIHGSDGDTGALIFTGGGPNDQMPNNLRRFNSPIAVHGKIIVAADNALYAFHN